VTPLPPTQDDVRYQRPLLIGNRCWVVLLFTLLGPVTGALPYMALFLFSEIPSLALVPLLGSYLYAGLAPLLASIIFIRFAHSHALTAAGSLPARFSALGAAAGALGSGVWHLLLLVGTFLVGTSIDSSITLLLITLVLGTLSGALCGAVASFFARTTSFEPSSPSD